jgi:hypothetical protein
MVALCYYYLEEDYNCYVYFSKMENVVQYLLDDLEDQEKVDYWSGELVLHFFISGLLAKQHEDYVEAKNQFEHGTNLNLKEDSNAPKDFVYR